MIFPRLSSNDFLHLSRCRNGHVSPNGFYINFVGNPIYRSAANFFVITPKFMLHSFFIFLIDRKISRQRSRPRLISKKWPIEKFFFENFLAFVRKNHLRSARKVRWLKNNSKFVNYYNFFIIFYDIAYQFFLHNLIPLQLCLLQTRQILIDGEQLYLMTIWVHLVKGDQLN